MPDTPPPTVAQQITAALLGSKWAKVFAVVLALFAIAEAGLLLYKNYLEVYVLKQQFDVKTMQRPTEDEQGAAICAWPEGREMFPETAKKYCPELMGKK